jgi:hypothetical protein
MKVGRFKNSRLDSFRSWRENDYRHPHLCIIVSIRDGRIKHINIEEKQGVVEKNPCTKVLN